MAARQCRSLRIQRRALCLKPKPRRPPAAEALDEALARLLAHAQPPGRTETRLHLRRRWPRAGRRTCVSGARTCRRTTTARWTATRCAAADMRRSRRGAVRWPSAFRPAASARRWRRARAARIFTGAQIPEGADAVVMQEDTVRWRRRAARRLRPRAHRTPAGPRPVDPPRRRRRVARRRGAARGRAPDAAGAGPGGQRRPGRAAGVPPPARGAVLHRRRTGHARRGAAGADEARRHLQLQPLLPARAAAAAWAARCTDLGIVPDQLDATSEALRAGGRRQRPDPHHRRRVGGRGRPHQARRAGRWARSTCGRSPIKPGKPFAYGRIGDAHISSACPATRCPASSPSCCWCGPSC